MKPELERLCAAYIANRDAVKKAFKWDNNELFSVCANIFCACGQAADADRLKACHAIIREHTKPFSKFRGGKVRSILASMLAMGEKPEVRMELANEYYRLLKRRFRGTEYLVLTAFLLADLADRPLTEETVARGKELFERMNRKHRILTDQADSVFAMLLAHSDQTDDEVIEGMESCFQALRERFSSKGGMQTAAQVLSMTAGSPEEKARRVIDLYDALTEAGVKYGRSSALAPLAALSLADTPIPTLTEEIQAADAFLQTQDGYGARETDEETRALHAVMIVSDQYAGTSQVNVTVMTNTLEMLISKQQASRISLILNLLQFALKFIPGLEDKSEEEERPKDKAEKKSGK